MKKVYTYSYKQSLIYYCVRCFVCQLLARWLLSYYIIDRQWNFYSKEINIARSAAILVLCNFENSWQEIRLDGNTFTNHAELRLHNRHLSIRIRVSYRFDRLKFQFLIGFKLRDRWSFSIIDSNRHIDFFMAYLAIFCEFS